MFSRKSGCRILHSPRSYQSQRRQEEAQGALAPTQHVAVLHRYALRCMRDGEFCTHTLRKSPR